MCKWALVLPLMVLSWSLVGCSDDTAGPDLAVDIGVYEASTPDLPAPDTAQPHEAGADQLPADLSMDQGSGGAPLLDDNHTGWQKTACESCHKLPPFAGVDAGVKTSIHSSFTQSWECAICHGGNGACAPNDPTGSSKTNHVNTDTCGTCHGDKHGYTPTAPCLGCHFAGGATATFGKVPCN